VAGPNGNNNAGNGNGNHAAPANGGAADSKTGDKPIGSTALLPAVLPILPPSE
jgi:hypothetical protein